MAPTKSTSTRAVTSQSAMNSILPTARKGLTRRANAQNNSNIIDQNVENMQTRAKRKADNSPIKNEKIKRSALGNLTNNIKIMTLHPDDEAKQVIPINNKKPTAQQLQAILEAKKLICKAGVASAVVKAPASVLVQAPASAPPVGIAATVPPTNVTVFAAEKAKIQAQEKQQEQEQQKQEQQKQEQQQQQKQEQEQQQQKQEEEQQQPQPEQQESQTQAEQQNFNKMITRAMSFKTNEEAIKNCNLVLDKYEELIASRSKRKTSQKKPIPPPAAPIIIPVLPIPKLNANKPARRISNEFNKTEESLYMSALEDTSSCESTRLSGNFEAVRRRSAQLQLEKQKTDENNKCLQKAADELAVGLQKSLAPVYEVPDNVEDFDKQNWDDPFQVSHYAMDIFNYLKTRESEFIIGDYMEKQIYLSKWMRTLLVDWMVEVQETFELNHETLYLAVKIVDLYLCRQVINKEKLQLLGAAALFIACKYDERQPPLIEDFLYICDGAYKHNELVHMEMETLRTIDYDLGIPLSYRFLRRYARCAKVQMPTLTLARYILELSLMDYATISCSDSQMAAASLFMALRMHNESPLATDDTSVWTPTLIYYSGYNLSDFAELVPILNAGLHRKHKGAIKTIRSKYSHRIFHEVAKVPLLTTDQLFKNNFDLNASGNATT